MTAWPSHPVLYEINTWIWLAELAQRAGQPLTLATVPEEELERLGGLGFDGVWLMGVWQRSPTGRQVAATHPGLRQEYLAALPNLSEADIVGSPYAVHRYVVDPNLGGPQALAHLRQRLARRGLRLMLDFVPNHLALDHPWTSDHPELLVQGGPENLASEPANYFARDGRVFAHGRDPYFPGWTDTVQLDYRRPETRQAMLATLLAIAEQCDGVRCDMAMLVTREVFERTWDGRFDPPQAEFWPGATETLKLRHPGFLLLAEVYWDAEWALQQMGFDHTYDKRLYDRLVGEDATAIRGHLLADSGYQRRLARFIENHDEPRALSALGLARSQAAAVIALTLPGLRLLHEGQLEGRRTKVPVQLGRRPDEAPLPDLQSFYRRLLDAMRHPVFHEGTWHLLEPHPAWGDNPSHSGYVAHLWTRGGERRLAVANLGAQRAQCYLPLADRGLRHGRWHLRDLLSNADYLRDGDQLLDPGLYLDMEGYGYHLFKLGEAS
jgi:hypothetical protein